MPEASRNRSKTGFVTPVGQWMRDASGGAKGAAGDVTFSNASRAWALRVWQAGWTGAAAA